MKYTILIYALFLSLIATSKELTAIDTTISGKKFKIIVVGPHQLGIYWGNTKKSFFVKDSIFTDETESYKEYRILYYINKHKIKKYNSLYVYDKDNVFIVLPTINSDICLIGLKKETDSIALWKKDYVSDIYSFNIDYIMIRAPSIIILKKPTEAGNILFGSKTLNIDIQDSCSKLCSFITLLYTQYAGHFLLDIVYPALVDPKYDIDIYEDDIKYYNYIINTKFIENPLDLRTKD